MDRESSGKKSFHGVIIASLVIILLVGLIPLVYSQRERIAEAFRGKDRYEVVWELDFEDVPVGKIPEAWTTWNGPDQAAVTDKTARSGRKSLRLFGLLFRAWSGGVNFRMKTEPPFIIEFDVMAGNEKFSYNGHPGRAGMGLNRAGTGSSGFHGPILNFDSDGYVYLSGETEKILKWKADRWYHVKILYEHDEDSYRTTLWIDGVKKAENMRPLENWRRDWKVDLVFVSGDGTSYFDDVKLLKPLD